MVLKSRWDSTMLFFRCVFRVLKLRKHFAHLLLSFIFHTRKHGANSLFATVTVFETDDVVEMRRADFENNGIFECFDSMNVARVDGQAVAGDHVEIDAVEMITYRSTQQVHRFFFALVFLQREREALFYFEDFAGVFLLVGVPHFAAPRLVHDLGRFERYLLVLSHSPLRTGYNESDNNTAQRTGTTLRDNNSVGLGRA